MEKRQNLIIFICGTLGSYLLHFPLRLFEDWVMGEIEGYLVRNLQYSLGFFITWILPFIIVFSAIWLGYRFRNPKGKKQSTNIQTKLYDKSENLTDTLTAMHRRLVELQKEKASRTKVSFRQFKTYIPTLAHKMGTVKLSEWPKFNKDVKRKIQAKVPKVKFRIISSPRDWIFNRAKYEEYKERVYQAGLAVASENKDQLFGLKEWTFQDAEKASDWVDGYDWGIQKIRDNDSEWDMLDKSISHYNRDGKLRELIQKHIDLSHIYANISLVISYTENFRKDSFSFMLHEILVGSPISPGKAETALEEILGDIDKRLEEIQEAKQSLVLTIRSWAIGLTGMTGYPKEPGNAAWLLLEVSVNAIGKPIDALDIIIDGKTIPANYWLSRTVTAFNAYFNVSEWHYKGNNQVELIAHVGDNKHRSGRITIDFDVEVWGKHLI